MGKTIVEKILSNHSHKDLSTGDFVISPVDFAFGQDGTSNLIIERLQEFGIKRLKIPFCMVIDHSAPSPNAAISTVHKRMRNFAIKYKTSLYDVGCGICHQVIPEAGHILPGDIVLGADSHTCTYGALGALATGVGSTDLAISLATGASWFKVPATIKIIVNGKIPYGVFAKDIILSIIGDFKSYGATYQSIEFAGQVIDKMGMDGRFTICNMVVEMGAKCSFMPVDEKTLSWLKTRITKGRKIKGVSADKDATYGLIKKYNITDFSPVVAYPHAVDNVEPVKKFKNIKINQAFLGTCTNARLDDLKVAARILKDKKVASGVKFIIAPSSRMILEEAIKLRLIEVFLEANAIVLSPGCGPCVGTHNGIPADGEIVISTANRNFKGRMGNPKAEIFLASPATVAASAITGKITDPREYL